MKMKTLLLHKLRPCIMAVMALMSLSMASCIMDEESGGDEPSTPRQGDVWLSMAIHNLSSTGRATTTKPEDSSSHPEEDDTEAECYINTSDVNVLLFDDQKHLIHTFSGDECKVTPTTDKPDEYTLKVKAHTDMFNYAGTDANTTVNFSIMIVANLTGTSDGDGAFNFNEHPFKSIAELSNLYRGFGYTGSYTVLDEIKAWEPSIADKRLIPMAGIAARSFILEQSTNDGQTEENPIKLNEIYIQRAMAQVRLVDALAKNGATDYKITDVTLTGFNNHGAYLPIIKDDPDWSKETCVVEYGTAKAKWYDAATRLPSSPITYIGGAGLSGITPGTTYDAFRFYVPEFDVDAIGTNTKPTLTISVQNTASNEIKDFTYEFPQTDFARNHIYQVVVTGVNFEQESSLTLLVSVCPWSNYDIDLNDTDTDSPSPFE